MRNRLAGLLAIPAMVIVLFASGAMAATPPVPAPDAAGVRLAACKPPPLPAEGCIKNPCTGKTICCTRASGRPTCTTMK